GRISVWPRGYETMLATSTRRLGRNSGGASSPTDSKNGFKPIIVIKGVCRRAWHRPLRRKIDPQERWQWERLIHWWRRSPTSATRAGFHRNQIVSDRH